MLSSTMKKVIHARGLTSINPKLGIVLLSMLFSALYMSADGQEGPVTLAILEDTPGMTADAPDYHSVRVAFFKAGNEWKAFPSQCEDYDCLRAVDSSISTEMTWTVGFDGQTLGHVSTQFEGNEREQMLAGQFKVAGNPIPTVGKPIQEFAGWLGSPVYRPLILNSRAFVSDPEQWKPSPVSDTALKNLRLDFKRKYPKLADCESGIAKQYREGDIRVVKSYGSKRNWQIVQLETKGCAAADERGDPLGMEWFTISPAGHISYLDSNMHLVDTGDYDNTGESVLVFSIDDYNRGGYKLFYNDFQRRTVFEFSYH